MSAHAPLVALRWLARFLAAVSVAVLLLFLFGEPFGLSNLSLAQLVAFVFFPFGLIVGLILGWFRELVGGLVAVGSVACFYLVFVIFYQEWPGWWFLVFALPGFLYVSYGLAIGGRYGR